MHVLQSDNAKDGWIRSAPEKNLKFHYILNRFLTLSSLLLNKLYKCGIISFKHGPFSSSFYYRIMHLEISMGRLSYLNSRPQIIVYIFLSQFFIVSSIFERTTFHFSQTVFIIVCVPFFSVESMLIKSSASESYSTNYAEGRVVLSILVLRKKFE